MNLYAVKFDALKLRKQLGLSQSEFWGRIGVTQSGGCRYEQGRAMPKPVRALLILVYVLPIERALQAVRRLRKG